MGPFEIGFIVGVLIGVLLDIVNGLYRSGKGGNFIASIYGSGGGGGKGAIIPSHDVDFDEGV